MAIDLGKQIGPLPLGAWIAVVGVGLGIAYYTRGSGTSEPVEVEDGSSPSGVGDGSVGGWIPTTPSGTDVATVDLSTNDSWGQAAIRYLIAQGYNPTAADQAIRKYLAGEKLSVQETALVGFALMRYGPPPTPLPPVDDDTTPPPGGGGGTLAAPDNLRLISVGRNTVSLRWDGVQGATSYIAHISPASRVQQGPKNVVGTRTTWYFLRPNTTYYFSVQAKDLSGNVSGKSNIREVRTKP